MIRTEHIQFNPWKHHAGFIQEQIKFLASQKDGMDNAAESIKVIGESLMDLYTGLFTADQIHTQVTTILGIASITSKQKFINLVNESGMAYRIITFTDNSRWVLRIGDDENKFVHIHPAKYSPFTIRVRAKTLKTAVLALVYCFMRKTGSVDLQVINSVRKKYLGEPPVKSITSAKGIIKVIELLKPGAAQ